MSQPPADAPAAAPPRSRLSFEQTVPRSIAHRRALGEVFVADSVQSGDGEFLLAVQVPRAHTLWFDRRVAVHDTLSTAEAARQGAFVVVHRHLGVPVGLPFSLQRFGFEVTDLAAYRDTERDPLEGILRFRLVSRDQRTSEIGSLTFEGDLEIAGARAMTMAGQIFFVPKADYEALRAYQRRRKPLDDGAARAEPPRPLDPSQVGRHDPRNVVLGAPRDGGRFPIVVDQSHPSFFDHGYDHLPGPLIGEAFRQASIVVAARAGALPEPVAAVTRCEASFTDFAEIDAPAECSAEVTSAFEDGRTTVAVGLHQFGRELASGELDLQPFP